MTDEKRLCLDLLIIEEKHIFQQIYHLKPHSFERNTESIHYIVMTLSISLFCFININVLPTVISVNPVIICLTFINHMNDLENLQI